MLQLPQDYLKENQHMTTEEHNEADEKKYQEQVDKYKKIMEKK